MPCERPQVGTDDAYDAWLEDLAEQRAEEAAWGSPSEADYAAERAWEAWWG